MDIHIDVLTATPVISRTATRSLHVQFVDGTAGYVHFEPNHLRGVFAVLADRNVFNQVRVENGYVTWPGELDLAPDAMYANIRKNGEWVLE